MIVTVTIQKGGVGKTTLSMNLATYWHRQQKRVVLIDADPQRSSERWAARAEACLGKGVLPSVHPCADGTEIEEACERLRKSHERIVIDTPPSLTAQNSVASAIQCADLVVLPIRPSILDLDSLGDVRRLIEAESKDTPVLVVVSLARASWSATREVRHSVEKLGYPCAKTVIHERASHARAALTGSLWSLPPATRRPATGEVAALAAEIDALLAAGRQSEAA
ncbi:MAG: ParA family protein [Planctomycetes bacterium]|nr:ParA family protein [Planctomycetota bacterium]